MFVNRPDQGVSPSWAGGEALEGGHRRPRTHDGFRHEAFFCKDDDQFLAGTLPFITNGTAAGQPVLVAVGPARAELLRRGLGSNATKVEFVDPAELTANPARMIPRWRAFTDLHPGQAVRGIGEPIWAGRRRDEVAECQMHEALLNMAIHSDTRLWLMCPYDTGTLSSELLAEAQRSHPVVIDVEQHRESTAFGGAHHVEALFGRDLPLAAVVVSRRAFGAQDYVAIRADTRAHALSAGVDDERAADLALAVHEVAVNSVTYGRGTGELRIWTTRDALVCELRSTGRIVDPMVGRLPPPADDENGRGLWMAHQLCDLVQVRSGPDGTAVRIHTWL
ncbi:hypothetical protein ASD62_19345 [Phycicoccus sp. Root563]|uniref:sensor histidine kinase n=1 Tax=Phycicoccus sp. Root563 TaxID=1736562 RepID=UPI0007032861|nr:sensor histidine kinase [Phycicoccus sp. Root563]KQZ87690.1 hypothetical protein ASD62_19345 [Phycicoccus sp. Root563]